MNRTFEVYSQKEIDDWVDKMYVEYIASNNNICANDNSLYPYVICCNLKTGNVSKAKCNPNDVFDRNIGIAYAYARLMNLPEPKLIEKAYRLDECVGKIVIIEDKKYYVVGFSYDKKYCICECLPNHCSIVHFSKTRKIRLDDIIKE